jgi:hypothetical protein
MTHLLAQGSTSELGRIGGDFLGPFGHIVDGGIDGLTAISHIVSSIVGVLTIAGGIWFILQFLIGGFNWITSGGDKAKLQQARDRITNAFIGLIVLVAGAAILSLAGTFLGVDFTLSKPTDMLDILTPKQ